jgi:hypothetical protein
MKLHAIGAAILAGAALSGCAGGLGLPGGSDQAAILAAVNAHIEGCERHYHGQTVPPSLSVQIDCAARPAAPVTATTTP